MQNKSRRKRIRQSIDQLPPEGSRELQLYSSPTLKTLAPLLDPLHFHDNTLTSPLLRLPAELRLRIYELLLHVGQISIDYRAWTPNTKARPGFYCRTFPADADPWASPLPYHSDNTWGPRLRGSNELESRAAGKRTKSDSSLCGVTLLSGVCRQLYHETATLPFKLNTLSFFSPRLMNRYLKERRMTLKQRRAVKALVVREKPPKAVENMFGGLELVAWRDEAKSRLIRRTNETSRHDL